MSTEDPIPRPARTPALAESITTCHRPDPLRNNAVDPSHMSMRTFMQLDSPQASDDEDSSPGSGRSLAPLSANTPTSSGTHWIRFFPELSSHFSLPSSTAINMEEFTPPLQSTEEQDNHGNSEDRVQDDPSTPIDLKPVSSFGFEMIDDASSCYSHETSLTSASSEYTGESQAGYPRYAYRSADAFSILCPVAAGVFDDASSVSRFSPSPRSREPSNKPLPETPPFRLAPLGFRQNPSPLSYTSESVFSTSSDNSSRIQSLQSHQCGPTFTQAADELEDVLEGLSAQNRPAEKGMQIPSGPLQISRGNMDLIPTRPAPRPPTSAPQKRSMSLARVISRQRTENGGLPAEQKYVKKCAKQKGPFSFSVPRFGRKHRHSRGHLRSFSSSTMRFEMEFDHHWGSKAAPEPGNSIEVDSRENVRALPSDSSYECRRRPSSLGSERELRQRFPHPQTSKIQPINQVSRLPPPNSAEGVLEENKAPVVFGCSFVQGNIDSSADGHFISSSKTRRSNAFVLPYQPGSLQAPEVVYELEAGPSFQPRKVGSSPLSAPDRVVLSILDHSNSLDDLFNFAIVNKCFYRVFKKHELQLIQNALFDISPSAWELRQVSPPWDAEWEILVDPDTPVPEYTPTIYLRRYAQDILVLAQLKSLILAKCTTFLRRDTIHGLAGIDSTRATEVDEAFWRIWTFCRLFGCRKNREHKTDLQIDWLNGGRIAVSQHSHGTTATAVPFSMNNDLFEPPAGFGRGNRGGLSQSELYDMMEVWTCLSVLLQPLHGKCAEAREAGIFDAFEIPDGDNAKEEAVLEEWTSYILTLGLSPVLCLGSICESDTTASTFYSAQSLGLTKWEPLESEGSRIAFLKEAVSKVYKVRENELLSSQWKRLSDSSIHVPEHPVPQWTAGQSNSAITTYQANEDNRQRQVAFAAELRDQRIKLRNCINSSFATERPISNYTAIMDQLDSRAESAALGSAVTTRSLAHTTALSCSGSQTPSSPPVLTSPPPVLDPTDRAIRMIVQKLGFNEEDAKWALKNTDTGQGIDVRSAVSLLYKAQKSSQRNWGMRHSSLIDG